MEPRAEAQVSPSRVVFMPSSAKASAGRDRKKLGFCFVLTVSLALWRDALFSAWSDFIKSSANLPSGLSLWYFV